MEKDSNGEQRRAIKRKGEQDSNGVQGRARENKGRATESNGWPRGTMVSNVE